MTDRPSTEVEALDKPTLWECFATAVHFLTRVTISNRLATSETVDHAMALNRSVVFFPLVGGLIGLLTASVLVAFIIAEVPVLLAAFLALGVEAYVTGAFHEDAFADTCDAFGGGWTRQQVLEIMKDSRLGTYGTIALVIGVASRAIAMGSLADEDVLWACASIIAAAMISRFAIIALMATTAPIASRQSQARDVSGKQPVVRIILALVLGCPFAVVWAIQFPWVAGTSAVACILVIAWYRRMVMRRLGGTTGDTLGACGFLTQLVVLTGATMA